MKINNTFSLDISYKFLPIHYFLCKTNTKHRLFTSDSSKHIKQQHFTIAKNKEGNQTGRYYCRKKSTICATLPHYKKMNVRKMSMV